MGDADPQAESTNAQQGRRVLFTGPNEARLERFTLDDRDLADDEVLLETRWSLISTGTELANFTGLSPNVWIPGAWGSYPHVPGYTAVGQVLTVGSAVPTYGRQGDRVVPGATVFAFTPHASVARAKVSQRLAFPLEPGDDPQAVLLGRMAMVAMSAIRALHRPPVGRQAAVIGLGLVGLFAAQLCRLAGADVRAYDLAPHRVELARSYGIDAAVGLPPDEEGRNSADIVIEAIGNPRLAPRAVTMARNLGEVVLLGTPRGPGDDGGPMLSDIHFKGVSVIGAFEWLPPFRASEAGWGPSLEDTVVTLLHWIRGGRLRTDGMISDVVAPERCQEIYRSLAADPNALSGWSSTGRRPPDRSRGQLVASAAGPTRSGSRRSAAARAARTASSGTER
jgi:2-desacetyl-2-hydroxyethyl bacteriochlorophyllide A dehydrogenase